MEKEKRKGLLLSLVFLVAGGIFGLISSLSVFLSLNDFTKGFFAGIAITFLSFGLIYLLIMLAKSKSVQ